MPADPFNLRRFLAAQDAVYQQVLEELSAGRKQTHWMWFIFPQLAGLGSSELARHFALSSRQEAMAYHAHEILGARLRDCTGLVLHVEGRSAREIFGTPDDLKFRSSMTLFAAAAPQERIYRDALGKYFAAQPDERTHRLVG